MIRISLAFALGVALCHQLPALPDPLLGGLIPVLILFARAPRAAGVIALVLLGLAWTSLRANAALERRLPHVLEGRDLPVEFQVVDEPRPFVRGVAFVALVRGAPGVAAPVSPGCRLRLRSYQPAPEFRRGQHWRATLRLRRIRGTRNPGDMQREHRALRAGECATGYIRPAPAPVMLPDTEVDSGRGQWRDGLARLRTRLTDRIRREVSGRPGGALVLALAVGERGELSVDQRRLLRATATAHLIAISGLHIGLAAGCGLLLGRVLASRGAWLCRRLPAQHAGVLLALISGTAYAAMAGFALPTQRAVVMLGVVCIAAMLRRRGTASASLGLALLLVLLLDPLAMLGVDLWLSFLATAALVFGLRQPASTPSRLVSLLRVQLLAGFALMPVSLYVFGYQPLLSPLYNLVAVPITGVLAVPASLLGGLLVLLGVPGAGWLLGFAAWVMEWLMASLEALLVLEPAWRDRVVPPLWAACSAAAAVVLMLGLRRRSLMPVALVLCLPALWPAREGPGAGELWLDLLDVKQGLAAVVRTDRRVLVYDTGAPWIGSQAVLANLRRTGDAAVDVLMVSHADSDHAGGVAAVLDALPVRHTISNALQGAEQASGCGAIRGWRWGEYRFQVLHPPAPRPGNDGSCVLRIAGPGGSVLLPGDIEAPAERELVRTRGGELEADVLVVPHHGSRTSSTAAFLQAVDPRIALIPSGYRNRFGFPHDAVVERYRARGIELHDTGCTGWLRVMLTPARPARVRSWWPASRRFWHADNDPERCP